MAEKTTSKQRGPGRPFPKGSSGNPTGRPRGALNKTTLACRAILQDQAEMVVQALIAQALAGDVTAAKAILERFVPPMKESVIDEDVLQLPVPVSSDNASEAMGEVLAAVASGRITPGQGAALVGMIREVARIGMPDVLVTTAEHQISPATKAALDALFERD